MKEIPLTQGKISLVDDEDYERLNQFKWYPNWNGYTWYAKRANLRINGKQKQVYIHRVIMNTPKGIQVDHRNGNGLDNRKANLRLCTHQENQFNKKYAQKNNKLGIKGVCWREDMKKFHAQIWVNSKRIHLGYFNVMGDADGAYRTAEEKYFGKFARTA